LNTFVRRLNIVLIRLCKIHNHSKIESFFFEFAMKQFEIFKNSNREIHLRNYQKVTQLPDERDQSIEIDSEMFSFVLRYLSKLPLNVRNVFVWHLAQ